MALAEQARQPLATLLSGDLTLLTGPTGYEESITLEEHEWDNVQKYLLLVPPGQEHRRSHHWNTLLLEIQKGQALGLINVVCAGHQTFNIPYKQHKLYSYKQMGINRFVEKYIQTAKEQELEATRPILQSLQSLKGHKSRIWMVTLVTKQDLWWGERERICQEYQTGEYSNLINEVKSVLGDEWFHHEYLYASLVMQNWKDSNGDVLAETTHGYDQECQSQSLRQLFMTISALLDG